MDATFVELPAFERHRSRYLDDEAFRQLQWVLLCDPAVGPVIRGTGGLRKARFGDAGRGKGKRGGLRVIYFHWSAADQFWLFTLYAKGEAVDLSPSERALLKEQLKNELRLRLQ